ncbi:putative DNA-binding transcriptional regulator [Serratia fonticola]|uniref:Putative DNA-binding transcriptional regulator n=1 Tax=Serratia fonticola TaxID=47917 RepID=A0A4V6KQ81_SERFO|nr:putative DNA-binding transcriptional regulator [Serratia fonticola]
MDPASFPGTDCRIGDQPTHAIAPYPPIWQDRFWSSTKADPPRYALRREVAGESYFPLYQIDKLGKAHLFATLYSLYPADSCAVFDEQSGEWQVV